MPCPHRMRHKFLLDENEMPTRWYNVLPDLPDPAAAGAAPGHRAAGRTGRPGAAVPDGPDPAGGLDRAVRRHPRRGARRLPAVAADARCTGRTGWRRRSARRRGSTTSTRASRPAGSHKPNTAVPQAFYNAKAGITKLTTETGAGQWGTALAFACAQFGLDVRGLAGACVLRPEAVPPDDDRDVRRHRAPQPVGPDRGRARDPRRATPTPPARSGIAISEAVEVAAQDPTTNYALGSVLNHVLLHQTIIGEEALLQLAKVGETPDLLVGCTGGGSNFGGLMFPFLREKLAGRIEPDRARRRAGGLPVADPGHLRLRLRRHRGHDAADEDAHARPRLRAGPDPRRRPALPRDEPADQPPLRAGPDRGGRQAADGVLRGRGPVRPHRGHRARRPSRRTRWPRRSRRRCAARRRARRR